MSFISNTLGFGDGGGNFNAEAAKTLQPVGGHEINAAYTDSERGLSQQLDFLKALRGQSGVANQSAIFDQQQALANQLQGLAGGTGPNPALQQLQNTTGQNVAQQAALMASQRGTSANAGLLARQAAMQGANIQQQAVGQGAALAAQQQLAGISALQQQQNLLGNMANTQVGQLGSGIQNYNQAAQGEQSNLLNAISNFNNSQVAMQSNMNSANAGVQGVVAGQQGTLLGGAAGGIGSALGLANGGMIPSYAAGGSVSGPRSFAGKFFTGISDSMNPATPAAPSPGLNPLGKLITGGLITGAKSLFSSAPQVPGQNVELLPNADMMAASKGAFVPGKAAVSGDSLKNDKVPAVLSPGEIVIPRSIVNAANAPQKAADFVAKVLAQHGKKKG